MNDDARETLFDRYEIRERLGEALRLAWDRAARQLVVLRLVPQAESDAAFREAFVQARRVTHPNVCRLFDLVPAEGGTLIVMEHVPGETLDAFARARASRGGVTVEEFRRIANGFASGLAFIHRAGLVHGGLSPEVLRVVVAPDGTVERAVIMNLTSPAHPKAYASPERAASGQPSAGDDVYAMGLSLLEMWTAHSPAPGYAPRSRPLAAQRTVGAAAGLSLDELRLVFGCLAPTPERRLASRDVRMFDATQTSTAPIVPMHRIDPGRPLVRNGGAFSPEAQALLVTFTTHGEDLLGTLLPLRKPKLTLGRTPDKDICVPDPTVSALHARVSWTNGGWEVEDAGSTNGTYGERLFTRVENLALLPGGELQVGETRLLLVNFTSGSPHHERARRYLGTRDALTRLLAREPFLEALRDEGHFADWADAPLPVALYSLVGPPTDDGRFPIPAMLAARHVAGRVAARTALFLPTASLLAGGTSPLTFAVAMTGASPALARTFVEETVADARQLLPPGIALEGALVMHAPGGDARSVVGR